MYARIRRYGELHPETFTQGLMDRSRVFHHYRGKQCSIKELAARAGVSWSTMQNRLRRRESAAECVNFKPLPSAGKRGGHGKFFEYDGKRLNMAGWARELGITRERVRQRLAKYPVEVALSGNHRETKRGKARS